MINLNEKNKIDFVIIWVDGSDQKWQEEKNKYSDSPDAARNGINRYRDWGLLKYWFRGVEKFAPWVNNVYFITCGHYPEWLNLNHPKLKFLKHEDYIPKEYLPTFSSHPIELNLHRIPELSNEFIYFNDDTYLIKDIYPDDFFKNGKPRYIAGCDYVYAKNEEDLFAHILLNNCGIINKYFDKSDVIRKNILKWYNINYGVKFFLKTLFFTSFKMFSALADPHLPSPLLKTTMQELWEKEEFILDKTSKNKFRTSHDVNQYLFKWYDIARDNFEPFKNKNGRCFVTYKEKEKMLEAIENQKYKMLCFSDDLELDFENTKKEVNDVFEKILPNKSSFEM